MNYPFLNLLRWTSALAVMISHARNLLLADLPQIGQVNLAVKAIYFFTGFGHEAVIVFFVLSGFLVGGPILARFDKFNLRRYAIDRGARIYTALLPALLLTILVDLVLWNMYPQSPLLLGKWQSSVLNFSVVDHYSGWIVVCNFLVLPTIGCVPLGSNGPLWSLGVEWFFYLLCPAFAFAFFLVSSRIWRVGCIAGCSLVCYLISAEVFSYAIVWFSGSLARCWVDRSAAVSTKTGWMTFGVFTSMLILSRTHLSNSQSLIICNDVAMALPLAMALASRGVVSNHLFAHESAQLSKFSYWLYVSHFPLLVLITALLFENHAVPLTRLYPSAGSLGMLAVVIFGIYASSWIFGSAIEATTPRIKDFLIKASGGAKVLATPDRTL